MSLTVELSADLERLLEAEAERTGRTPGSVAREVLQKSLKSMPSGSSSAPRLSAEETPLLETINRGFSSAEMERYFTLIAQRQAEALTAAEAEELRGFTQRMEQLAVDRMRAVVALGHLRGTSVPELLDELQIQPPDVL